MRQRAAGACRRGHPLDRPDVEAAAQRACGHRCALPGPFDRDHAAGVRRLAGRPKNRKHILLGPLERADTQHAIATMWPQGKPSAPPEIIELVERVTGGVPLFIEEVCQWMAENAAAGGDRLPQGSSRSHASVFESVLNARLEPLGPAREIARAAAVAGSRVSQELVQALLPEFGEDKIAGALDALAEAGFVTRARHGGAAAFGFRHSLIQETIYNGTLRKRRQDAAPAALHGGQPESQPRRLATTAALAEHAERAGLIEEAIGEFVSAGTESSSRSAMAEARQLLEHALALCEQVADPGKRTHCGYRRWSRSARCWRRQRGRDLRRPARTMRTASRSPAGSRSSNGPSGFRSIGAGGTPDRTFRIQHDRAMRVQEMLSGIDDPEIKLQIKHCIWAIDFNLGRHRETLDAIEAGLALYDEELAKTNRALFGGHDAKVCGLGQKALSLWLTGSTEASDSALAEMIRFVDGMGHTASKAHSLDTEAVSAFYREDFDRLAEVSERMADFAARNGFESLAGLSQLFAGWAKVRRGDVAGGHALFDRGLATLKQLGSMADLPLYLDMQATISGSKANCGSARSRDGGRRRSRGNRTCLLARRAAAAPCGPAG